MLRIASANEIGGLLLELPALFRLQEQRSVDFPLRAREWLGSLEQALGANRLYQAGLVAALRSGVTSAEQGQLPPGLQLQGRVTRSKAVTAMASRALHGAAEIASAIMAENDARFAEAERVANQIVAIARSRDVLPPREPTDSHSQYLRGIRHALASSADLENAVTHLEGLVGSQDALVFLDRALGPDSPDEEE
jgi:hypothetical protein